MALSFHVTEQLLHTWDLATAVGAVVDNGRGSGRAWHWDVCSAMIPPQSTGPGKPFDTAIELPADATIQDRLLAYSGRQPVAAFVDSFGLLASGSLVRGGGTLGADLMLRVAAGSALLPACRTISASQDACVRRPCPPGDAMPSHREPTISTPRARQRARPAGCRRARAALERRDGDRFVLLADGATDADGGSAIC